jgi:hypothetical protein
MAHSMKGTKAQALLISLCLTGAANGPGPAASASPQPGDAGRILVGAATSAAYKLSDERRFKLKRLLPNDCSAVGDEKRFQAALLPLTQYAHHQGLLRPEQTLENPSDQDVAYIITDGNAVGRYYGRAVNCYDNLIFGMALVLGYEGRLQAIKSESPELRLRAVQDELVDEDEMRDGILKAIKKNHPAFEKLKVAASGTTDRKTKPAPR